MSALDLIGFGINTVDILFRLPDSFEHGQKYEIKELAIQGGGPASNGVCVAGKLGFNVGFIAKLGENSTSNISRQSFADYQVKTDLVPSPSNAEPAIAIAQVDPATGERTIFYTLNHYQKVTPSEIPISLIENAKVILVDGYEDETALRILEIAQKKGIPSVIDIETGNKGLVARFFSLASDIILPFSEAKRLSQKETPEEILKALRAQTSARLTITDGSNGSWGLEKDQVIHCPAFRVSAFDTTGCGDTYHGGYAVGLLLGLSFHHRLEFASYIAARVAMKLGGRTNLPTRQEALTETLLPLSENLKQQLKTRLQ